MYIRKTDVRHVRDRLEFLNEQIDKNVLDMEELSLIVFDIWDDVMCILDGKHLVKY